MRDFFILDEWLLISISGVKIWFFTNFPQYKNTNFSNFIFAVPLKRNWTNEVSNFQM